MANIEATARENYDHAMKLGQILSFALGKWIDTLAKNSLTTQQFFHIVGVLKGLQMKYTELGKEALRIDQEHGSTAKQKTYDALAEIIAQAVKDALHIEIGVSDK